MSKRSPSPLQEAEALILKLKTQRRSQIQEHYVGGCESEYRFLELSSPQVHAFAQSEFSWSQSAYPTHAWQAWDEIWNKTTIYDLLSAAISWAQDRPLQEQKRHSRTLTAWSAKANNWALADGLCSIYARLFEESPEPFGKVLEAWSRAKNPWQRRMSIVSLFYYSRSRERLPSYALAQKMILRQLEDPHFYVQKGVGWALRECWNVYPRQTFDLLQKIAGQIPPPAWTAATEKLSKSQKLQLTQIRKSSKKITR